MRTARHQRRHRLGGLSETLGGMMTCDEVAEYLRVHVSSVRRWSRSGQLVACKVGYRGDWRFREQDVLSFLYDPMREGRE